MSRTARRRLLGSLVVLALTGGAAAAGAASNSIVSVAHLLGPRIATVKQHDGGVSVLVPTTMPLEKPDVTESGAKQGSYTLEIAGAKHCHDANVCVFAFFEGRRGGRRYGKAVKLANGIEGGFADIQCGAACSPASIDWIEEGVLYRIEANPSIVYQPKASAKAIQQIFVEAADQAIEAGPR